MPRTKPLPEGGPESDFLDLEIPPRARGSQVNKYSDKLKMLEIGPRCLFIPCEEGRIALLQKTMGAASRSVGKITNRKFTTRRLKVGVQYGVGVWRIE